MVRESPRLLRHATAELRILGMPAARLTLAIASISLGVALVAGSLRVLPVLLAPQVPLGMAFSLGRSVALVGLEVALFVAPPIAWALAASRLVERGDVRALSAIGVSSSRVVLGSTPIAAILALSVAIASFAWGREAAAPGRLSRALLQQAREACDSAVAPAAADLPLFGLSWVCLPGAPPRVIGVAPFGAEPAYFAATSVDLADDLRTLRLKGLEMLLPAPDGGAGTIHVSVDSATITGLAPSTRASNLRPLIRGTLLGVSALLLTAFAGLGVVSRSITSPAAAIALGIAGPLASLAVFGALERSPSHPLVYLMVPLAGVAAILLATNALVRPFRLRRLRRRP
jgi:hypothetical protein